MEALPPTRQHRLFKLTNLSFNETLGHLKVRLRCHIATLQPCISMQQLKQWRRNTSGYSVTLYKLCILEDKTADSQH